jgi:hypothetical protein
MLKVNWSYVGGEVLMCLANQTVKAYEIFLFMMGLSTKHYAQWSIDGHVIDLKMSIKKERWVRTSAE